ncbi:MAG: hypothetical protein V7642_1511 [Burkholderiales bacterium]|jgi:hypothetical protein
MAAHMEYKDIKALPVTPYEDLRDGLASGDLFFASGDYLLSKAIQKIADSPWSHVGIVFRLDGIDRIMLLESVEDTAVRFIPLSKYLTDYEHEKPYRGRAVLARCDGVDAEIVSGLAGFGIDELARPYRNEEVADIVARIALGIGKKERDRQYVCSELVYECFSHAGKEFEYDIRNFIAPEHIWINERVSLIARIL